MKKITLLLCSILFTNVLLASNSRYRIILTDDPATTIMIGWDQNSGTNPIVHFGTTDYGTTWGNYPTSKSVDRTVSYKGMNNNFAKLTGLTPDTNYYFVIRDSEGTSQRFWFRTAPSTNETMSFISGGDSRNNRTPRQNANKLVSKLKPTAVFFGGDMTNGDSDGEWQDWFDDWQLTIASDGRMFPIIPARGNHEGSNNSVYHLFNTPSTDIYYSLTFGTNLYTIYTLNSEISAGGSQYSWLQSTLASDNAIWKSAQYHKPMRPHNLFKSEGSDEYNNWAQLFYDEGVRLVYESDSHTVKTTWPLKPCSSGSNCDEGFEREDINGTVYVGEGCWGAPLRSSDDTKNWTRDSGSFNQFKWVCVSSSKIEVKTIIVDNADAVAENSNTSVCELPNGIDVWSPSNGDVVTLIDSALQAPSIAITSQNDGDYIVDGTDTLITTNATDTDGTITQVEFKINNTIVSTDTTAPFELLYSFSDGAHQIETIAYDNDGLSSNDIINISVGDYSDVLDIATNDDAEQKESSGEVYLGSSDLELVYDSYNSQGNQTIGIRFTNVNIPQNATVTNAYVQFMADGNYSDTTELLVFVEDDLNPSPYQTVNYDVTSRNYLPSIYWSPAAWSDDDTGIAQRTPNLAAQIQNMVNNANWVSGNAVAIKIEGTGVSLTDTSAKRRAESADGQMAPVLHIEYTMNSAVLTTDVFESNSFNMYPNPVEDILFIDMPSSSNLYNVQIFTLSGALVLESELKNNTIDLRHIRKGIYLVTILDANNRIIHTDKIIKK
ncbi:MAG: fibronectin type III domain-containing protein [Flavobacteriaceae bacterium]